MFGSIHCPAEPRGSELPSVGCGGSGSMPNRNVASWPTPIAVFVSVARAFSGRLFRNVMSPPAAPVLY